MSPLGGFRAGRRRGLVAGAVVGSAVARRGKRRQGEQAADDQPADDQPADESQAPAQDTGEQMAELEKLGELRDKGILTEEEFTAKKQQILGL